MSDKVWQIKLGNQNYFTPGNCREASISIMPANGSGVSISDFGPCMQFQMITIKCLLRFVLMQKCGLKSPPPTAVFILFAIGFSGHCQLEHWHNQYLAGVHRISEIFNGSNKCSF